jgi:RNA polymerase sigma factor (sigma-70 family)
MAAPKTRPLSPADAFFARRAGRVPTLTVVPIDPERTRRTDDVWVQILADIAAHQDRPAFARLFEHFAPRVKRYLMVSGSSDAQAEDLAQETMAMVWRKAALYDPAKAAVSTWVFTIARNLCVDHFRRRNQGDVFEDEFDFDLIEPDQPSPDELVHTARLGERLRTALAELTPDQLEVIRLAYGDDESQSRIATLLGIPLGTVKTRVRAALIQLRRLMDA